MKPTYEEALAFCVQHYVDRGNTVEDATAYVTVRGKDDVFRVYETIQEEMKRPVSVAMADLLQEN